MTQITDPCDIACMQRSSRPAPSLDALEQCEDCRLNGLRLCMYHGYPNNVIPPICDYRIVDIDRDEFCIATLRQQQEQQK